MIYYHPYSSWKFLILIYYANRGNDNNDFLLNHDKGYLDDSSDCGDSDRGVCYGSDDGLKCDIKLFSNNILGGNSDNKVVAHLDLVVMAILLLQHAGGLLH